MTYVWPLTLDKFSDLLRVVSSQFDIQRNDELSGTGNGRIWQAELAPPIWKCKVELGVNYHDELRQIGAVMRKMEGAKNPFLLADLTALYPQYDKKGLILGANTVTLHTVGDKSLRVQGLPAGYQITIGDRGQVTFGGDKVYYFEFSETATASGAGILPSVEVYPHPGPGIEVDGVVILKKPAAKMIMMPGTVDVGTSVPGFTTGATFEAIEKKA